MSFVLSKLFWACAMPASLIAFVLLLALYAHRRRPTLSRVLIGLVALFCLLLGLAPVAAPLIDPLQNRFPQPPLPERIDGIIVLGGALRAEALPAHQPSLNEAGERIVVAALLARLHPEARVLFTGGSGKPLAQAAKEADVAGPLLERLGVAHERLVLERDSRTTWENAVFSRRMVKPQPGGTWLLLTSAWHMPRAVGCFRRAGWSVLPYPVDYLGQHSWLHGEAADEFATLGLAEKEWIGLLAYRLMGRSDALFPAP